MSMKTLVASAATTVLAFCAATSVAQAQDIFGGISGEITNDAGHPLAGVQVRVTNVPTHDTITTTTSAGGFFSVRNLPVGGPYDVVASDATHPAKTVRVDAITLGAPYDLNFSLGGGVQELTVKASRIHGTSAVQTGPRSTFTATDIQTLPSFSRDLKDLARLNPFVTVDPSNSNAILIAGNNNHVNTIYVDGVRQSDDFGLNNSGYPTQRSPISVDAVAAFNVEVAPYDVRYGDFQGGVLNIVTKSGSNEFHGGGFYEYDSAGATGDVLGNRAVNQPKCDSGAQSGTISVQPLGYTSPTTLNCGDRVLHPAFKDKNYGVNIGGPIVPDKLFFFFDYEKYEGITTAGYSASDGGGTNPVKGVTNADIANITSILKSVYGYDTLGTGGNLPVTDEKYFAKVNWNITDKQRLFVSYQRTDGTTLNAPNENVNTILGLGSNYYIYEQKLEAYTADLQSQWSSNFATEIEYSHKSVESPSVLVGKPFAEFQITLPSSTTVYVGPDISRQANNLGNTDQQVKLHASYTLGNHVISAGYEYENLNEFDLFVQDATGLFIFNKNCGAGDAITNLINRQACSLTYQNAYDNNPSTGGTSTTTETHTLFLQDEWRVLPTLTLQGGLRYERYQADSAPLLNPRFVTQYGFPNNLTIDGEDILEPRVGFRWRPDSTWTINGGAGLFSGGNPGVYTYDSYTNPGNLLGLISASCTTPSTTACNPALSGVTGSAIPANLKSSVTAAANTGNGIANALAPNFKPPADWKASIEVQKVMDFGQFAWLGEAGRLIGADWRFHGDYLYQKTQNAVFWKDLWEGQNVLGAPAPDGRPMFNPARYCANPAAALPGVACTPSTTRSTGYDIELAETSKGFANIWSVGFGKSWASGFDFDLTYTHQQVKDISPATSSVALSNYSQNAVVDPNNPGLSTSSYEIKYQTKLSLGYEHKFFGDNKTGFRLFAYERSGLPFSYTFYEATPGAAGANGATALSSSAAYDPLFGQTGSAAYRNDQLLYIPRTDSTGNVTATSDPRVTYNAATFDLAAFNKFLKQTGLIKYAGGISPRNGFFSRDVADIDVRFTQEFPAFFPNGAKGEFYFDIINLGNLLNKQWGVIDQVSFPGFANAVQARNCQALPGRANAGCTAGVGNFYQYDVFRSASISPAVQTPTTPPTSAWVMKFGVRYKF